jgi:4'-phosphopantetheinyl transferase
VTVEEKHLPGNDAAWDVLRGRLQPLRAPDARVTLHWAPREADAGLATSLEPSLSASERVRAARFGRPHLRHRYVIGRATLRVVLAAALQVMPGEVPIARGRRGRPFVRDEPGLDFNVTHTADVMLVAIARDVTVGVDVERADRRINAEGIARRCLSQHERSALAGMSSDEARIAVLRLWTCKEAMSKATGDGLAAPFRALDVGTQSPPRLRAGPPPYRPQDWRLHAVDVPVGHFATLALWSAAPVAEATTP